MIKHNASDNQVIQKLKRVVIKEEFVALTGDIIKAIILNQFIYWSERVQDFDKFIIEEKARAKMNGEEVNIKLNNGWIYKSAEELSEETMLNLAHNTIRRHIKYLVDKGWLDERTNPDRKWDRTTQYRVNLVKINADLMKLGYILQDYKVELPFSEMENASSEIDNGMSKMDNALSKMDNGNSKMDNAISDLDNRTSQNVRAIPEITTETTTEITTEIYPSLHPSTYKDNITLEAHSGDGLTDGGMEGFPNIFQKTAVNRAVGRTEEYERQDFLEVNLIIRQICESTGATPEQVQKAIRRANQIEKEGKLKSNYLKLVEAIAKTIVKEDLLKNNDSYDGYDGNKKKKEFIKSLYMG